MAIRMKMKQEKMRKIGIASALVLVALVILGLYGAPAGGADLPPPPRHPA